MSEADHSIVAAGSPTAPACVIKNVDMSEEMQIITIQVATEAMAHHTIEKNIAAQIKQTLDKKFGPTWHVVVGKNFGSYCTHETGNFLYFYMDTIAILVFKAG